MRKKLSAPQLQYFTELLVGIFEFMLLEGASHAQIRELVAQAESNASLQNRPPKSIAAGLSLAAEVLDTWHRNRRYLDHNAIPRAIPLTGKAPSVEALVRAQRPREKPRDHVQKMLALGLIIPQGKLYAPIGRVVTVRSLHPFVISYVAKLLQRALMTVKYNLTAPSTATRFLEGFAEIPNLSRKDVTAFRRFTRAQGWSFLGTVNEWLEARGGRDRGAREPATSAGVQVFAWADTRRRRAC